VAIKLNVFFFAGVIFCNKSGVPRCQCLASPHLSVARLDQALERVEGLVSRQGGEVGAAGMNGTLTKIRLQL
jgi:hypothetical protein